jgi:hypothetical protein
MIFSFPALFSLEDSSCFFVLLDTTHTVAAEERKGEPSAAACPRTVLPTQWIHNGYRTIAFPCGWVRSPGISVFFSQRGFTYTGEKKEKERKGLAPSFSCS